MWARRLIPGAVLVLTAVLAVLFLLPAAPSDSWFPSPPAVLPVSGSFEISTSGRVVASGMIPLLDPGRYQVADFGDRLGGRWWPAEFDVVVAAVTEPFAAVQEPPSSLSWWPLLGVVVVALFAALWAISSRRLFFVLSVVSLLIWVGAGSLSVSLAQTIGLLLLLVCVFLSGVLARVDPRARAVLAGLVCSLGLSAALWVPGSSGQPSPSLSASVCTSLVESAAQDCWSALAVSESSGAPEEADDVVRSVLAQVPPGDRVDACRRIGFAVGSSLVDPLGPPSQVRATYARVSETCDFALLHGMSAAAVSAGEGFRVRVADVCSPVRTGSLSASAFASQCWHGSGQGVARASGLDMSVVADFCMSAPDAGDRSNCAEGSLVELIDSIARPGWGVSADFVNKVCTAWPSELSEQCWRYVAWALLEEGTGPGSLASRMMEFCRLLDTGFVASCWRGVGEAVVFDTAATAPTPQALLEGCSPAPVPSSRQACEQRVLASYVSGYMSREGSAPDVKFLCALVPLDTRRSVCEAVERFVQAISGKGSASAEFSAAEFSLPTRSGS